MRLVPVLIATVLLAGCGQSPAMPEADWEHDRPVPPAKAPQPPATMPLPVAPDAANEGARLLAGLRQTFLACKGVEAEVKSWSEGHYKAGKKVSELRKNTYRSKLIWQKPNKLRGDILETDNFLVGGAKMVSTDGKTITVKAGGVLGLFPVKLDADADMLASNRNHKFGDMTPDALLKSILGPTARWVVVGESRVEGALVKLVRIENIRHLDREISEEVIGIEPGTFKLRSMQMYAGRKKVVDYQFTRFRWNPTIQSDTFEL